METDQEDPALSWDGCPLEYVKVVAEGRMAVKLSSMSNNCSTTHSRPIKSVDERCRRSFHPAAV